MRIGEDVEIDVGFVAGVFDGFEDAPGAGLDDAESFGFEFGDRAGEFTFEGAGVGVVVEEDVGEAVVAADGPSSLSGASGSTSIEVVGSSGTDSPVVEVVPSPGSLLVVVPSSGSVPWVTPSPSKTSR